MLHEPVSSFLLQDCVQLNQYKLKDEIGKVETQFTLVPAQTGLDLLSSTECADFRSDLLKNAEQKAVSRPGLWLRRLLLFELNLKLLEPFLRVQLVCPC